MLMTIKDVVDVIERIAAAHVNEFGIYAPLIEYLDNRLDAMRTYSKPGEKSCGVLAGYSLALTEAKKWAKVGSVEIEISDYMPDGGGER